MKTNTLISRPDPAADYPEAMRRVSVLGERERAVRSPDAALRCLTHGKRTEHALVLVHGYTNCSEQFAALGQSFFERGFNVLIITQPRQGLPDRMTGEQALLTAEELVAYADQTADLAHGLGNRVTFAGISGGGVLSAWAWLNRDDVSYAVLLAPAFGLRMIPAGLVQPAVNLFTVFPNFYQWWDPVRKMQGTPEYTYPRVSTRALAQFFRLACAVRTQAACRLPAGKKLMLVTNPADLAVDNRLSIRILEEWRHRGADIDFRELNAAWKLDHDFIDPCHPSARTDIVYPLLVDWVTRMLS